MTDTKTRMQWLLAQLDNLNNGGNIRYDGNVTFQGARAELVDMIATYEDHSAMPAPVTLVAMNPEQLAGAVAELVAASGGIVAAIKAEIQESDISVLDAIEHTRTGIIDALQPA